VVSTPSTSAVAAAAEGEAAAVGAAIAETVGGSMLSSS